MESWDDLRYVIAVAAEGSLSAAARRLGVNHSTVFRRIAALEDRLGARLFERLPRGYALTPVGERVYERAQVVEEEMHSLERIATGHDLRLSGTVRVTTPDTLARAILVPHLGRFHERYPGIEIEIVVDNRVFSLSRREADIALRPGLPPEEGNVAGRRVCVIAWAAYASKEYLRGREMPATPADLAGHDLVTGDDSLAGIPPVKWLHKHGLGRSTVRSNSVVTQLDALCSGLGIGVVPCFLADPLPEVVRLFPPIERLSSDLYLLLHSDLRHTARIRAFADFLVETIASEQELLEGRGATARK